MSTGSDRKNTESARSSPKDYDLAGILFQRIAELGFSKGQVKDKLGVSYQALRDWNEGKHSPQPENYYKACALLRLNPDTKEPDDNGANGGERSLNELEDRPSGAGSNSLNSAPIYTMPVSPKEGRLLEAVNQIGTISVQTSGVLFVYLHSCVEMRPTLPQGICIPIRPVSGGLESIIASGIYVYRYGSQYQVRRLVYTGRGIYQALASNPDYPPLELSADTLDKDFELLGIIDLNL